MLNTLKSSICTFIVNILKLMYFILMSWFVSFVGSLCIISVSGKINIGYVLIVRYTISRYSNFSILRNREGKYIN